MAWSELGLGRTSITAGFASDRPERVVSPLFSVPVEYHPCSTLRAVPGETVPRESCGTEAGRPAVADALADAGESVDPDSLRMSALLALTSDDSDRGADAAITRLTRALRLSRRQVPLLVDLSGAHLVRAQRTQNPRDLLEGVNYALEAVAAEPGNAAARFNTALGLQALGVDEQAELAWTQYLRVDSTSEWAREARERRASLPRPVNPAPPQAGTPEAQVRAFATSHPLEARLYGFDVVLGDWGRASEAGAAARAEELLTLAERLGNGLRARGGDASLADAVHAIRVAEDDPAALRTLSRAHRTYASAQRLYEIAEHRAAGDSFALIVNMRPQSSALMLSARQFQVATLVYARQYARADSVFEALVPGIDASRYPGLAGRAMWMRATGLLRDGNTAGAREQYQLSARHFERAGETEFVGAVWSMVGEAAFRQRDTVAAYGSMHRGVRMLRAYGSSVWLHNALLMLAASATTDHMRHVASVIQDEDLSVATRVRRSPAGLAEAFLGRARIRALDGRSAEAVADVRRAEWFVNRIPTKKPPPWMVEVVHISRAMAAPTTAPTQELDSAVAFFARNGDLSWLFPALLQRADVRLARGDLAGATEDLGAATTRLRGLSEGLSDASLRTAVLDQARTRIDQLIMLHLRAGDTVAALRAVERGRVSFAPGYGASALSEGRPSAPRGQVAVEYALIGDTLLTWTLRGHDVRLLRRTVPREPLLAMIERGASALESPARAGLARPELARLYDLLVRPVEASLGPPGTPLVILVDGEIAAVPFSALLNSRRGRYVVQDHPVRFAATLAEAARPALAPNRSAPALLVADPAFDPARYPTLDRLRDAWAEVDSLRTVYRTSVVLQGPAATRDALRERAPGAGVIHYAGHAVFDDSRPERSALVLAGPDTTGRLTASDVNGLHLRGVRLVVLAACRTARSRQGRSGGLAGFSGALVAAGAGGVVGSLWEADDRLTQPLMIAFHRAYRRSGDPAAALREAQLEMLRSPDPARRSPAAWAGFRYIGS